MNPAARLPYAIADARRRAGFDCDREADAAGRRPERWFEALRHVASPAIELPNDEHVVRPWLLGAGRRGGAVFAGDQARHLCVASGVDPGRE